ncbi:MAG: hypothetical protein ACI8XZ_005376 [Gammaproteobacteria bacterium]|jgi:hypothetical protein
MTTSIPGGCACGAVRYECGSDPAFSWNCHCRDCQRASGSAYCGVSYVPKSAFSSVGEVCYYEVIAESGNRVSRGFCRTCGSPVFIVAELVPELIGIWAASQDDPNSFQPSVNVWTASATSWGAANSALPSYENAPSSEDMQVILGA